MSPLVYVVMFGWIPAVLYLFKWLPPQRAAIVSFITAWLFLPQAEFTQLPGLDYTKMSATCFNVLLAAIVFDTKRFSSFKPSWLDLPILVWCVCPYASSISNDLGWYDGLAAVFAQTVTWGLPYFLGRLYLNDLDGLRKLAIGICIGGLLYIPFCLIELIISPQLHRLVYGFYVRTDFSQTLRYGGYRPTVFMEHGLMVGAWMMAAALLGVWLWKAGVIKQIWGIPIKWLVGALLVAVVLVKSTGAWVLLAMGIVILFSAKSFRTSLLLLVLSIVISFCLSSWILLAMGIVILFIANRFRASVVMLVLLMTISSYLYVGVTGKFSGDQMVSVVSTVFGEDRAGSLKFRFDNEKILSDKARQKMIFGWGGWGRSRVFNEWRKDISVTDSLWIITFGAQGAVGVISLTVFMLLPVLGFVLRYPVNLWTNRKVAPAAALAVLLALYMVDCLLNAMINPIYTLMCGGITGLLLNQTRTSKAKGIRLSTAERYLVQ